MGSRWCGEVWCGGVVRVRGGEIRVTASTSTCPEVVGSRW